MGTLLKEKINYEYHAEVHKPVDPLQVIFRNNKNIVKLAQEIQSHIDILMVRYPGYVDFYYEFKYTTPSKGCYSAWFDLYGIKTLSKV